MTFHRWNYGSGQRIEGEADLLPAAFAHTDEDRAREPVVFPALDVDGRGRADVVRLGINFFPAGEAFHHILRTVPVAAVPNIDIDALRSTHRIVRFDLGDAVRTDQLPIGPAGQNNAAKSFAREVASDYRNNPSAPL